MSSISLRSFGYSSSASEDSRRVALQKAINHHGFDAVEARLDEVLSFNYNANMEDDWEWMNIMKPQPVIATPPPIASVRLSTFGYSTKLPDIVRQKCLNKAVQQVGLTETVKRLEEVADLAAPNMNKKNVLLADKIWLTTQKVSTPAPTAEFIFEKMHDMIIITPDITLKEAIPLIEKMWGRKIQVA